jgi:hypothetical protein
MALLQNRAFLSWQGLRQRVFYPHMATVLILVNCLLLLFWIRLWADPRREFYFNPFLSGPIRLVDTVIGALGLPAKFTCLLMLAFGLVFRTALAIRFGYEWTLSLGSIFTFTPRMFTFQNLLVFSVLDFLLFIARLWAAYLLIRMITPSSRRDRATEAFEFAVRPFSLVAPPLRIALLVIVHLLIVLELHMLMTKQLANFEMLNPGAIAGGVRSLSLAHPPAELISVLKLGGMVAASLADGLNAIRVALVTCILGGLAAMLIGNQIFRQIFAEGLTVILGRFARAPLVAGMMDFTPLIFFFALRLIYSACSGLLLAFTAMIS